jgi:hypothetical protein
MERREFLRQAAVGAAGLMLPEGEKEIVDGRLTQKVTVAFKGTALSDLCDHLRADTGVRLAAGPSVADEKVTLFCEKLPLREVMRQLSRPFGYAWLRSGTPGQYHYELAQDLRSQLLEEELRNRDRNAALLALEREMDRYRPYLSLSPDEAFARSSTASPAEKPLLERLARNGWGAIQMYFQLSAPDLAALRVGQRLTFSSEPSPGEQPLPPELARGVLQSQRDYRLLQHGDGFSLTADLSDPRGVTPISLPGVQARVRLEMPQTELGQFALAGSSGFFLARDNLSPASGGQQMVVQNFSSWGPWAVGANPAAHQPGNQAINARFAADPALHARVTVKPHCSCHAGAAGETARETDPEPMATTADVLEALHRATGLPIVSDFYTRLYPASSVSVQKLPLFEALNQLADTVRFRWSKEGGWLQFRSASFFTDRLKEVPNRFLARWTEARRQSAHSILGTAHYAPSAPPALTLDDLVEIAQLPDPQLDAAEMAEGAKECWGLAEWDLARNKNLRRHLRFLAGFSPAQRQRAMSSEGLTFTQMPLAQQQRFLSFALEFDDQPLQSLDELSGAALRVEYSVPGGFEWRAPGPYWLRWVVPLEPGQQGRRGLRPVVRERTWEAALQALHRVDPHVREAVVQAAGRADPRVAQALPPEEEEIAPTRLSLAIVYVPGSSNARNIHALFDDNDVAAVTW